MIRFRNSVFWTMCIATAAASAVLAQAPSPSPASRPVDDAALVARSLVSAGNTVRLQRVLAKAKRGGSITVGVIGGSITQGAAATTAERRYGNLVADWWRKQFSKCEVRFVNAGIGATGSNYGTLRAQRDLLAHKPDFVVVEYGVNDPNTRECAETLEGLLRQILGSPSRTAVVLLFTMHNDGGNAQEWQEKLGRHYGLPMVSFRDALWPEIAAGRLKWEDVEADIVHPNDRGHAYSARFVTDFLAGVLRSLPEEGRSPAIGPLPKPMISDLFERVTLTEADDLTPVSNQGWTLDSREHCWKADKPGSTLEFDVAGTAVLTMHRVTRGPMGRANVSVDGGKPKELEGRFEATWGGYRQTNEIVRGLAPGKHRVRIELLAERSPQSDGNEFRVYGLGTAGPNAPETQPAITPAFKHVIVCHDAGAGGYEAFPDVIRTKSGEMLCVFYAGFGHVSLPKYAPDKKLPANCAKAGRICMVRSRDDGHTWSKAEIVVDTDLDDRDSSIVELPDGELICNYFSHRHDDKLGYQFVHSAMVRSRDGGKTWGPEQELFKDWVCSSPIRVLSDGRLALAVYYHPGETRERGKMWGGFTVSSDNGRTWSDPTVIGKDAGFYLDAEPDVYEVRPSHLLMVMRPEMGCSWSHDGGKTWGPTKRIGFEGHAPYMLKTRKGILLLGHRLPGTSLHYSLDDGQTWKGPVQIDKLTGSYPSFCELPDGSVYCVYYEEGKGSDIRGVRFHADKDGIHPCEP